MCCSGDGVKRDELNVTRLCCGNDSDFMEMTTCVGGLMGDNTAVEPVSPILSPALEQENNVDRGEREACLVDAHNKSVFYENESENSDLSLTCIGNGGIVSLESAPSASTAANYASTSGRGPNQTVLFHGECGDDMEMTQCLPLDVSMSVKSSCRRPFGECGDDMEMTQCLPLDVSMSVKSSCRRPFGKRQDGPRERTSRYEDSSMSETVSLGDKTPFVEVDDPDVSEKVDTMAFLMELNTMEKPAPVREAKSAPSQQRNISLSTSSSCFLPSASHTSESACIAANASATGRGLNRTVLFDDDMELTQCHPDNRANIADVKALDVNTCSKSVNERGSESMPNKITDAGDTEIRFKHDLIRSSSASVAVTDSKPVMKSDSSINALPAVSADEISTSFIKTYVKQQGHHASSSFITKTAAEADGDQTATCVAVSSVLSMAVVTCPGSDELALSRSAVSFSIPTAVNQIDDYRCQLEQSLNEQAEHFPQLSEGCGVGPVRFGADAVERLFAAKESDVVFTDIPAIVQNALPLITAVADSMQTAEQVGMSGIRDSEGAATTCITESGFSGPQTADHVISSQTDIEPQKPLRNAAPTMSQTADDILTRVKLANSMPHHIPSKLREDNTAASIHRGRRLTNLVVKPKSAFQPVGKSHASSVQRHSVAASAFQHYDPDVVSTKELGRGADTHEFAGMSGNGSRIDLSVQSVEVTNNLTNNLVSFSVTENLDATKRDEMRLEPIHLEPIHLEPIRDVTLLSSVSCLSNSCAVDGVENLETSAAQNKELSSSAVPCSQFGSTLTLPVTTTACESLSFSLPASTATATNSDTSLSLQHHEIELTTDVQRLSLASQATSSREVHTDVDMETSVNCRSTELAQVVAAKSDSESGEANSSLPQSEVPQSLMFSLPGSEAEASPTHCSQVLSEDLSSNKVHWELNTFCSL